jgi:hypothetical protein
MYLQLLESEFAATVILQVIGKETSYACETSPYAARGSTCSSDRVSEALGKPEALAYPLFVRAA